jgi:alkyldihydroxyacetonephosphate synthase
VFPNADNYADTLKRWKKIKAAACKSVANGTATISHQHGVGKDHAAYMSAEKGELGMSTLQNLVEHFDPKQQLNPGTLLEVKQK